MNFWDDRYASSSYVYGLEPNDFLQAQLSHLPIGHLLSLGEGEGRNAVFLAKHGFDVTALDASEVGLIKAQELALQNKVKLKTQIQDLNEFDEPTNRWDAIIAIYCHLPTTLRQSLYPKIVNSLKPGGVFLLEAYSPEQLDFKTGGPSNVDMLIPLDELERAFSGFERVVSRKIIRTVNEGVLHQGKASVVQFIAVKSTLA